MPEPGRRATGCASRCSAPSSRPTPSAAPRCSTSTRDPARSPSRRSAGARRAPTSSRRRPARHPSSQRNADRVAKSVGRDAAITVHRTSVAAYLPRRARAVRPRVRRSAVRPRGSRPRTRPRAARAAPGAARDGDRRARRVAHPSRCWPARSSRPGRSATATRRSGGRALRSRSPDPHSVRWRHPHTRPLCYPTRASQSRYGIPAAAAGVRRTVDQHGVTRPPAGRAR